MFRSFSPPDIESIKVNDAVRVGNLSFVLQDCWEKFTFVNQNDEPAFIVAWHTKRKCAVPIFMIASDKFNFLHARIVKRFMLSKMEEMGKKYVYTLSLPTEKIDRWHRFLGMKHIRWALVDGNPYKVWILKYGN